MAAEQIVLPNGNTASLAATKILTAANDSTVKAVPVPEKKAIVFFIGGAADQEKYYFQGAYHNIDAAKNLLDNRISPNAKLKPKYTSWARGYNDAKGSGDIKTNFIDKIPSKSSPVYIVGHSLGGWNGAHLSKILSEAGYTIKFLVTLDPVGEGFWVWLGSDIYMSEPQPVAEFWINIRASSSKPDSSDSVADFGERWNIKSGPTMNKTIDIHHASADWMFIQPVQETKSALDLIFDSINGIFGQ